MSAALALIDEGSWRWPMRAGSRFGTPSSSASAARSCSNVIQPNPRPPKKPYQTAIVIAKRQGARTYELLASLALAKLYQSTHRPADAHAALAPALEAFAPTPEMPEIAEAQALLVAIEAGAHARHE